MHVCDEITKKSLERPSQLEQQWNAYQSAQSAVTNLNIQVVFKLCLICVHKFDINNDVIFFTLKCLYCKKT